MNPRYFREHDLAIGFQREISETQFTIGAVNKPRRLAYHTPRPLTQRASVTSGVQHRSRADNSTPNNGATHLASN